MNPTIAAIVCLICFCHCVMVAERDDDPVLFLIGAVWAAAAALFGWVAL